MRARPTRGVVVAIASHSAGFPARFCAPWPAPGRPIKYSHAPRPAALRGLVQRGVLVDGVDRRNEVDDGFERLEKRHFAREGRATRERGGAPCGTIRIWTAPHAPARHRLYFLADQNLHGGAIIALDTHIALPVPALESPGLVRHLHFVALGERARRVVKLGDCFRARGLVGEFPRRQQHVAPPRTVELGRVAEQRLDT